MLSDDVRAMKSYVRGKIAGLSVESSGNKALLARLRRSVGKLPGDDPELWDDVLGGLPEGLARSTGGPSRAEWSVHVALTLYALHAQSSDAPAYAHGVGFGAAAGALAVGKGGSVNGAHQKRMAEAARSDDVEILSWRLRGIVRLLGQAGIGLDYGKLAEDLYWFQDENTRPGVVLGWGRGYSAAVSAARRAAGKTDAPAGADS